MDDNIIANGIKQRNGNYKNHKLHNSSPTPQSFVSCLNFELVSLKYPTRSYTSLKDIIIPKCPSSPPLTTTSANLGSSLSPPSSGSGYEITIRNHLVKQAAWAYLQPVVSSSSSSSSRWPCFSRVFYRSMIGRFRNFACETVIRGYDWLVDVLWLVLCR